MSRLADRPKRRRVSIPNYLAWSGATKTASTAETQIVVPPQVETAAAEEPRRLPVALWLGVVPLGIVAAVGIFLFIGWLQPSLGGRERITLPAIIQFKVAKAEAPPPQRGTLPPNCPSCNAPARADEVDWIDVNSAECVYCGSVIHTQ